MPIQRNEAFFRPRARLLLILGEQLIAREVIAIVELVKNAYDADATRVAVRLDNVTDRENGQIVVEDNGSGMDLNTILNVWLEPATGHRTNQKTQGRRTALGRTPLGEKGVGRFAAHKLGDVVDLVTRPEEGNTEIHLVVDWADFDKGNYLDEVPVYWEERSPEHFTNGGHGTRIIVRTLRKTWTGGRVKNLANEIQELNSPFAKGLEFQVELTAPGFEAALEDIPTLAEVLDTAFYCFEGNADSEGMLTYTYRFHHPLSRQFTREVGPKQVNIRNPGHFGFLMPQCGPFRCKFYVLDLDRIVRRALQPVDPQFEQKVHLFRAHKGVRVYRDDFRVWPYGQPNDDWLGLDLRRVQAPAQRISNNQIVGFVEISSASNPLLRDKTNREGFIEDDAYNDFWQLVRGAINILEIDRRPDKDQVYEWITRQQAGSQAVQGDPVEESISGIHKKMEREGDLPKYEEDLSRLRTRYHETVESMMEPLLVAAGLGISYTIPVHEIRRNVTDLRTSLMAIREELPPGDAVNRTDRSLGVLEQIDEMVRGAGQIIRKSKQGDVRLYSAAKNAADIMRLRLDREKVRLDVQEIEPVTIRGLHNLIVTAILNLIDNSAYWLLLRETDRRVQVTVDRSQEGEPRVVVSDNGLGIQDDPSLLVKPFFTRKPDGMGLGLYIVERIMQAHGGKIIFLSADASDPALLSGANVTLVFPPQKEVAP